MFSKPLAMAALVGSTTGAIYKTDDMTAVDAAFKTEDMNYFVMTTHAATLTCGPCI